MTTTDLFRTLWERSMQRYHVVVMAAMALLANEHFEFNGADHSVLATAEGLVDSSDEFLAAVEANCGKDTRQHPYCGICGSELCATYAMQLKLEPQRIFIEQET